MERTMCCREKQVEWKMEDIVRIWFTSLLTTVSRLFRLGKRSAIHFCAGCHNVMIAYIWTFEYLKIQKLEKLEIKSPVKLQVERNELWAERLRAQKPHPHKQRSIKIFNVSMYELPAVYQIYTRQYINICQMSYSIRCVQCIQAKLH